jgi:CDP-diacylglycerol--glycerol-3-phosphate 3-phosphatidyltransferase/cardiolipin synthase
VLLAVEAWVEIAARPWTPGWNEVAHIRAVTLGQDLMMRPTPPTDAEPARAQRPFVGALPGTLTSVRLALGIAFPLIPERWRQSALLVAAATEFLDGRIARLLHAAGTTGRLLDPVADKVFVIGVLATLLGEGAVTPGQLLLAASRDVIVTAGASWVAVRRGPSALHRMPPSWLGKLTTAAQFSFLLALFLAPRAGPPLLFVTSGLGLAAGIDYVRRFR